MFTGIVESVVEILNIEKEGSNKHFTLLYDQSANLYIDQSIAHNGVCLTVTETGDSFYKVTAVEETLKKTNLDILQIGDFVNIERASSVNGRIDGHFVQGHVDKTILCVNKTKLDGSWLYEFKLHSEDNKFLVPRGSVCLNGVSLTIADMTSDSFIVTIIPYTYEHTQFKHTEAGDYINIEFDILGKYVVRYLENFLNQKKS